MKRSTQLKRSTPLKRGRQLERSRKALPARRATPRREQPGDRDPGYLALVRKMRCLAAGMGTRCRGPIDPHHPRHLARGAGLKAPDDTSLPLCRWHHVHELHANAGAFKGWKKARLRAWQNERIPGVRALVAVHRQARAATEATP